MTRKHYLIFGKGRVGRNMANYLRMLGHEVSLLTRQDVNSRKDKSQIFVQKSDIVAAAIPDRHIEPWYDEWRPLIGERPAIHFSGALTIKGMYGYHPLYSFPNTILSPEKMATIAFACPDDAPSFLDIFPYAPNPSFLITKAQRARYHALAVLSGNMVSFIWNETTKEFTTYVNGPPEKYFQSYISSIIDRFLENPTGSLTGPIARHDRKTVEANLEALKDDPKLLKLYQAFLETAWPGFDT